MTPDLPDALQRACGPLFQKIPLEEAMGRLVGSEPKETELVEEILRRPEMQGRPDLAAGLWLYVDDLDRSHRVSQSLEDTTGSFWHGIMHRREGDFSNSHYWMRRAAGHPLLQTGTGLEPDELVDAVAAADGYDDPLLVDRQRAEWRTLFEWCAKAG
jgi:hypothetical protein